MNKIEKSYLTPHQLCELLNIKESRLRTLIFKKEIPFLKIGRLLRFDRAEIIKWMDSKKVEEEL